VASANCAVYCNGTPVFADIDPRTFNMDPEAVEGKLSERTRAVIPVHFAGQSCDMARIRELVEKVSQYRNSTIFIIEDGSHALGSQYREARVGSCEFSDMTVLSFHPVKHITTGEGGAVLTNSENLYRRLLRYRSHGITSMPSEFVYTENAFQSNSSEGVRSVNPWYYEQIDLGYNYRLTDIQCALGLSQLQRIDGFIRRRREIVNRYNREFSGINTLQTPTEDDNCTSNFHLYVLLFDFERIGISRAGMMERLKARGIQTQVHYIPVHTQPFFQRRFMTGWGDCPNAEDYYRKCLSIPLFPAMDENEIGRVISEVTQLATLEFI